MSSRWHELYATSPSGKTLFVCLVCGRVSPTPDKTCPHPPVTPHWKLATTCAVVEAIAQAADETEGRHVRRTESIMVGVSNDGTALAQWQDEGGDCKRAAVRIKEQPK